jgi:hypothetical protein
MEPPHIVSRRQVIFSHRSPHPNQWWLPEPDNRISAFSGRLEYALPALI